MQINFHYSFYGISTPQLLLFYCPEPEVLHLLYIVKQSVPQNVIDAHVNFEGGCNIDWRSAFTCMTIWLPICLYCVVPLTNIKHLCSDIYGASNRIENPHSDGFVDYENAFGRVHRPKLWKALCHHVIPAKYV